MHRSQNNDLIAIYETVYAQTAVIAGILFDLGFYSHGAVDSLTYSKHNHREPLRYGL